MEQSIKGFEIDYFKTATGVYANILIPTLNPTFQDDTQIKGFGKNEKEAYFNLENEFEKYLNLKK